MRIPRLFSPVRLQANSRVPLDGPAGHHLLRVLRRKIGDPVCLFDGYGGEYSARVVGIQRHQVELEVAEHAPDDRQSPLRCHLGLAASKGQRMDWAIQKCTEMGVHSMTPLVTERTELKFVKERRGNKIEHWRQIAHSACEQCGRNRVPEIRQVMPLDRWAAEIEADLALVCCGEGVALAQHAEDLAPQSLALLIGPEGGLSDAEIARAVSAGFRPTRFGPRTLRTETAPVAIVSIAQYLWGDLA